MVQRTMDFILKTWIGRVSGVVILALVGLGIGFAWYLASPLFINETVDEAFPRAALSAELPAGTTMEEAELQMEAAEVRENPVAEEITESMDEARQADELVVVTGGEFSGADSFHQGRGSATIYQLPDSSRVLRLEDFEVTNGPRLIVLLSASPDPESSRDVRAGEYENLGPLKGNIGNQNYDIPDNIDLSQFNSVVIYCEPFHVLFSKAPLN